MVGHELKSRAYENLIYCNRISNEDGSASREIDLPNGGKAYILGNIIQQGLNGQNSNIIGYGLEGLTNPEPQKLFLINNTIWNQKNTGSFLALPNSPVTGKIYNNLLLGSGALVAGNAMPAGLDTLKNRHFMDPAEANLVDPANFNFQPLCISPAVDGGVNPGIDGAQALLPLHAYQQPAASSTRAIFGTAPDLGAYEAVCSATTHQSVRPAYVQQNGQGVFLTTEATGCSLDVYDWSGRLIAAQVQAFDWSGVLSGRYVLVLRKAGQVIWVGKQ